MRRVLLPLTAAGVGLAALSAPLAATAAPADVRPPSLVLVKSADGTHLVKCYRARKPTSGAVACESGSYYAVLRCHRAAPPRTKRPAFGPVVNAPEVSAATCPDGFVLRRDSDITVAWAKESHRSL